MASIHLQGILVDTLGEIDVGAIMTWTHLTNTGETIATTKRDLIIPPDGFYSIDVEYGQIRIDYTTRFTERFVATVVVNQDSTATTIPELLNAAVPVTDPVILEMQSILADANAAADTSEAFADQLTTFDLIGSTATYSPDTNFRTKGYLTSGDGGAAHWIQNGVTGQTPSQSPADLGNALLNDANGNQWSIVIDDHIDVRALGAVADAFYDAGINGYNGTDAAPYFELVSNTLKDTPYYLKFGGGNYRFARPVGNVGELQVELHQGANVSHKWVGDDKSEIWIDEDPSVNYGGFSAVIGNAEGVTQPLVNGRGGNGIAEFINVRFRGLWDQEVLINQTAGLIVFNLFGLDEFKVDNCRFEAIRGKASTTANANKAIWVDSFHSRIVSDCIRLNNCDDVLVDNNYIEHTDDDCIAIPCKAADQSNVRSRVIITNNTIIGSEGIITNAAKLLNVSNNIVMLSHGTPISVGFLEPSSSSSVQICGNQVISPIGLFSGGDIVPPEDTAPCIGFFSERATDGGTGTVPGEFDGTAFKLPYGSGADSQPMGYQFSTNDDGTISVPFSENIIISNNVLTRSHPAVSNYSDWSASDTLVYKDDRMFNWDGWKDPSVDEDDFNKTGVFLGGGPIRGFIVSSNTISNLKSAGVLLSTPAYATNQLELDRMYHDGQITNNVITNVKYGVTNGNREGSITANWSVKIANNNINVDPYHIQPLRKSPLDGSWDVAGSTNLAPTAINMQRANGCEIYGNTISNTYYPILTTGNNEESNFISGNKVRCYPVNAGYDILNIGVAVPGYGSQFEHIVLDLTNINDSSYGYTVINTPATTSSLRPASGRYVQGWVTQRYAPAAGTFSGWIRLTTGDGHMNGVDWEEMPI